MNKSEISAAASTLGKQARGIPKPVTAKMRQQRRKAAKRPRPNARGNKHYKNNMKKVLTA